MGILQKEAEYMIFGTKDPKLQGDTPPTPQDAPVDAVISPDTRRDNRIPRNQSRTKKWPVLDAGGPPGNLDLKQWRFSLTGLVEEPVEWTWEEFQKLPRSRVFADMHCVTGGHGSAMFGKVSVRATS
jgi:DMSO/TMAO reductase YedYZ molybdopterin-dependent catalytic subunit